MRLKHIVNSMVSAGCQSHSVTHSSTTTQLFTFKMQREIEIIKCTLTKNVIMFVHSIIKQ